MVTPAHAQYTGAMLDQWLIQRKVTAATPAEANLERQFLQAVALLRHGEAAVARERFAQGLLKVRGNLQREYEFLAGLALSNAELGRDQEALLQVGELLQRVPVVGRQADQEILYSVAGGLCFRQYDFGAAIENFRMAESFAPKEGGAVTAVAGLGYADTLMCVGKFREAKKKALRSLPILQRLKAADLMQAAFFTLGLAEIGLGDYKAVESQIVLARFAARNTEDNAALDIASGLLYWFQAFRGRSSVLSESETQALFEKARRSFANALRFYGGKGVRLEGFSRGGLALALCGLKRYEPALQEIDEGFRAIPTVSSRDLALGYGIKTLIYEGKGDYVSANQTMDAMLRQIEEQEERIGDALIVAAVQDIVPYPYARAASLLLKQAEASANLSASGNDGAGPKIALMMAERGRGRGLTRLSLQGLLDSRLSAAEREEWIVKSRRLALTRAAVSRAQAWDEVALPKDRLARDAVLVKARIEEDVAKQGRDELSERLFRREPDLSRLVGDAFDARPGEPQASQSALNGYAVLAALVEREPDTMFLEYAIIDRDNALVFALSKTNGLRYFFLPVGDVQLAKLARDWRGAILAAEPSVTPITEELKRRAEGEAEIARQFYRLLITPIESAGLLKGVKRLVVVANGPLLSVPFVAFQDDQGGRLFERFPITSSISLRVLTLPDSPRTPERDTLFAVADSLGDAAILLDDPLRRGMGRLPYARKEGVALEKAVPGSLVLFGKDAIRERVLTEMPRYAILHFAIHGAADAQNGLRSRLFLAPKSGKGSEAAVLTAQDVMTMRLSARMAVLSVCESAQGEILGGEGLMGLAWGFLAAGCPSVVGTDWSVFDETTEMLISAFYKELLHGARKDEALQAAMRAVQASDEKHRSPYFWAAFRLIGRSDPIHLAREARAIARRQ